jgi:hypothetical protein
MSLEATATKCCYRCGIEKPLDQYYRCARNADGLANECKPCDCERQRLRRAKDRERVNAYNRRYKKANRDASSAAAQRWKVKNRAAVRAHKKVEKAVREGVLLRPDRCEQCNSEGALHGHHHDYAKALEVVWLCPLCHRQAHRRERQAA